MKVSQLRNGDEVRWTDPDDGVCSRILKIHSISVNGDVVTICDVDGNVLQCFAHELS
jgi:hypothetical protein